MEKEIKDMSNYYEYLDDLRNYGGINMFGATPYLQEEFDISRKEAKEILSSWMKQYKR